MSFNNKIIKGLVISIVILSIALLINEIYWEIPIIESFIVSFISGAIVSLFVTYVQYKKEKMDIICYYNNEIIKYYQLLNNMLLVLTQPKVTFKKKISTAQAYFNNYLDNNRFRENSIQLNFILNDFDNIARKKIYGRLYEYSNGIYLMEYFLNPKKEKLDDLIKLCDNHRKQIDEGMSILTEVVNMNYPWAEMKKYMDYDSMEKK